MPTYSPMSRLLCRMSDRARPQPSMPTADAPLLAMLLATYGGLGLSEADEGLERPLEEGRALAERLGDTLSIALACRGLAAVARARGDMVRAVALCREDLAHCRAL